MNTIKFITMSDIHISSINPVSRKGDYKRDILEKLDQIKEIGTQLGVDFFVIAGDIFNIKAPMRNPHELTATLIDLFKSFPAPVYAIEGNHDLRNDSYSTFKEQPIYVLYASDSVIRITDITKNINKIKVRLRAIPFSETPDLHKIDKANSSADVNIIVLHLYSSPVGGMLFKSKIYSYEELSVTGDDIYVLGHYHINQNIQKYNFNNKDQYFVNTGAISRGLLSEDDIKRIPSIGYIEISKKDTMNINYECIPLKVKPPEEVFDLVVYEKEKKDRKEIQDFITKLKVDLITPSEKDKIVEELKEMNLEKDVYDKVVYFLQEAQERNTL